MKKYKVINASDESELAERVNEALKEGWKLSGSVSVAAAGRYAFQRTYYQAMVKDDE